MVEQTRFRNIDVSEEARSELKHLLRSDEVKVPVLVANDQVITELSAILSFLNKPV